jgi:hypothetical protein
MAVIHADAAIAAAYLASTVVSGRNPVECCFANPIANPEVLPPFSLFCIH